jgi:hypothetical protein
LRHIKGGRQRLRQSLYAATFLLFPSRKVVLRT